MSSKSVLRLLGLAAVGGTGYYFYAAGGSAQGAKERAEADLHRASADIKSHLPHREETDAKGVGAKAGAKFDNAVAEANKQYGRAESEFKGVVHDAKAKVDEMDKKVEDEAAKARSGVSGWFGGGSK